jgi:putative transposase
MEKHQHIKLPEGKVVMARNGYLPERMMTTSAGLIAVNVLWSRSYVGFLNSFDIALIPKYMRKSLKIEEAMPLFYLLGLSNNDFIPVFKKLFGQFPADFPSASITPMKQICHEEHRNWNKRDMSLFRYRSLWVDVIDKSLDEARLCVFKVMGATPEGKKELVAVAGGFSESTESWFELLRSLKERGMISPKLFIGDGALGFWKAIRQVYPHAEHQRCWVHKTADIPDKLLKTVQSSAKSLIHDIYRAVTEADARDASRWFQERYEAKFSTAVASLLNDEASMFSFYKYPAEHWQHIHTTNTIESAFSTVRLRTAKSRGQRTMVTTLAIVFKLTEKAEFRWQRLQWVELNDQVLRI